MTDIAKMTRDKFEQYLSENGIDESHEEYDNVWAAWLFRGENPNELIEEIRAKNLGARVLIEEEKAELAREEDERNWFLNHPSA